MILPKVLPLEKARRKLYIMKAVKESDKVIQGKGFSM